MYSLVEVVAQRCISCGSSDEELILGLKPDFGRVRLKSDLGQEVAMPERGTQYAVVYETMIRAQMCAVCHSGYRSLTVHNE